MMDNCVEIFMQLYGAVFVAELRIYGHFAPTADTKTIFHCSRTKSGQKKKKK